MKKAAWITWESQPRNKSMANLLDAELYKIEFKKSFFIRYFLCCIHTIKVLSKKYEIVIVQNPSIVLCGLSVFFKPIFGYKLVIDAHNAGVFPKEGKSSVLMFINNIILKCSDLVVVTNDGLVSYLKDKKILAIPITDPLPEYEQEYFKNVREKKKVFVICSWAEDEPIELYFKVAKALPEYQFLFSGNHKKINLDSVFIPENVQLLGFVSEKEYCSLLFTSSVTVDLTLRENCLVCGAYESISAEVPVILSDNEINRHTFEDAALYSIPEIDSLTQNIIDAQDFDKERIVRFKNRYIERSLLYRSEFYKLLSKIR